MARRASLNILVLNGPNLNLLGAREPDIYGTATLDDIRRFMTEAAHKRGIHLFFSQSNHEGDLIDAIQKAAGKYDGIILNPGGLTHTSVALADALRSVNVPAVEVHLSNILSREEYRRTSLTAAAAVGVITGFGWKSYLLGMEALVDHLEAGRARG